MESHEHFTRLWTEAQPAVAGYLSAVVPDFQEAEDILQEVAVILLHKFSQYDPQRPFIGWAIGIARIEVLMARRSRARSLLCYREDLLERISEACEELAPELEARSRALGECLRTVQGRASEMIRLRYEESLQPNAIATRLGLAVNAVRVMLSRTRDVLRGCIDRKMRLQKFRP